MTTATLTITTSLGTPSRYTETPGALDYDVTISDADGNATEGEVTLIPSSRDGELNSWGDLENWASDRIVKLAYGLSDHSRRELLSAIVAECLSDDPTPSEVEIEIGRSAVEAAEKDIAELANEEGGIESLREGASNPPCVTWGESAAEAARAVDVSAALVRAWRAAYEIACAELAAELVAEHDASDDGNGEQEEIAPNIGRLAVTMEPAEDEEECVRLGLRRIYTVRRGTEVVWVGEAADEADALAAAASASGRL
jgi:hypothetical protein